MNSKNSRPETTLGINIKKPIVYFQSSIRKERSEIREIPKEKANWTAIIILYLVLPVINSLKKL
jgi:hypothetical protein